MPVDTRFPLRLSGLSLREEIEDVVLRVCLAFDHNDRQLMLSTLPRSVEPTMVIGDRKIVGTDSIMKDSFEPIGPMDTQHLITGFRTDVKEGATTASLTCNFQNQHFRAGEGFKDERQHLLTAGIYEVDLIKEEDGWKVKTWTLKIVYKIGDFSVIQPASA